MKKTAIMVVIALALFVLVIVIAANSNKSDNSEIMSPSPIPTISGTPTSGTALVSDMQSQDIDAQFTGADIATHSSETANVSITPELTVIINELDDNEGLINLGLCGDELYAILNEKGISFNSYESDSGDHAVDFNFFDGFFLIMFNEADNTVNAIDVSGLTQVTATQRGLNNGDTYDKMIELYGDEYRVSKTDDNKYQIYIYNFGDHYFEVWFQSDVITSWRITK